jgi:ApbE superfamily uncharacterized protein (UPF0280 family)
MSSSRADIALPLGLEPLAADYRRLAASIDLVRFRIKVEQTDLLIAAERLLIDEALVLVHARRAELKAYIADHPSFASALSPLPVDALAPPIVRSMAAAAAHVEVGPMAAVAGAIAEQVGRELSALSSEIIIENGGDIYCASRRQRSFMLLAEKSAFGVLRVTIDNGGKPFGVCTSSGTSGHSLSFGRADAVMAVATDTALADAAATALTNRVQTADDLQDCIDRARSFGLLGAVAIIGDRLAAWGAVELEE